MSDSPTIHRDLFNLVCGEKIGVGMSREVWSSKLLPNSVVKVEDRYATFQNVLEYEIWQRVQGTEFERWFAPCEWISGNGSILVMAKTEPIPAKKYPAQMPVFFTDFKRTNYGLYKGRVVCHDYGTCLLFEHGMSKRMKRVDWWNA